MSSSSDLLPKSPWLISTAKDASEHFSKCLMPYIEHLCSSASEDSAAQKTLDRATIVKAGSLTQPHEWLQSRIEELRVEKSAVLAAGSGSKRKVLLLGSGLVAGPAVEVFSARSDVHLVIGKSALRHCRSKLIAGSNNLSEAQNLLKGRKNVEALSLDVGNAEALANAVAASDVVVRSVDGACSRIAADQAVSYRHQCT